MVIRRGFAEQGVRQPPRNERVRGMTGHHTLAETERAVANRIGGMPLDLGAMVAVSNIYRAANAIRNHLEHSVLRSADLTWTGFVVLWVIWIWDGMETRHVAQEAGISKGTLTGVVKTLTARGLVVRTIHPDDGRLVLLSLSPKGTRLMNQLFPAFNAEEAFVVTGLGEAEVAGLADRLRHIVTHLEAGSAGRQTVVREAAE
jgi:DNA-binding MarR family transcriptional regulator